MYRDDSRTVSGELLSSFPLRLPSVWFLRDAKRPFFRGQGGHSREEEGHREDRRLILYDDFYRFVHAWASVTPSLQYARPYYATLRLFLLFSYRTTQNKTPCFMLSRMMVSVGSHCRGWTPLSRWTVDGSNLLEAATKKVLMMNLCQAVLVEDAMITER